MSTPTDSVKLEFDVETTYEEGTLTEYSVGLRNGRRLGLVWRHGNRAWPYEAHSVCSGEGSKQMLTLERALSWLLDEANKT